MNKRRANPYVFASPVTGEAFADREPELKALLACMMNGQKALLLSPRRYGKTSLAENAIASLRRRGGRASRVSLFAATSRREAAQAIATAVVNQLLGWAEGRLEVLHQQLATIRASFALEVSADGVRVTLTAAEGRDADWARITAETIRLLQRTSSPRRPAALVIDEFQRAAEIDPAYPNLFKELVDQLAGVSLVFAGSKHHLMRRLSEGPGAPLLKVGVRISLQVIPRPAMAGFLRERAAGHGKPMTAAAAGLIYDLARGIPNDVQELAFFSFQNAARTIDEPAVRESLDQLVRLQSADLASAYEGLAPMQQRLLRLLARNPIASPYSGAVAQAVEGANPSAVQRALGRLQELELVSRGEQGWQVASGLMEEWLRGLDRL